MHDHVRTVALLAAGLFVLQQARAADGAEAMQRQLQQLQQQFDTMRRDYEARLQALEARLRQAEAGQAATPPASAATSVAADATPGTTSPAAASPATASAEPPGAAPPAPVAAPTGANAFNPAISLILSGSYSALQRDPDNYRITGFLTGAEIGPGVRGFSLGETELNISANVDHLFYGALNLALEADNSASVEEAFVQTTALPDGFGLKAGRWLSSIGYLNDKHAHTWDFVDQPLVYQAFLEGQLKVDGVQLRALLPTERFVELGAEIGAAGPFPSGGSNGNQPGLATLFAHTGGDVGTSHSWRAGLSYLWAHSDGRESTGFDASGQSVNYSFSGSSRLLIFDGVWKWAPDGNSQRTNLTLQGEYMRRWESGRLTHDAGGAALTDSFSSAQSGGYVQAVYQFIPAWRVGLRYDRLDIGNVDAASNDVNLFLPAFSPSRSTLMLDWSPSEFSRVRLQFANDRARYGLTDNQFTIQYQMSLGAHGAHGY